MKKTTIISVLFVCISTISALAQSVVTTCVSLDQEAIANSKFTSSKYYFKSFSRSGEKAFPELDKKIEEKLMHPAPKETYWMYKSWINPVVDEADADYTISGEYFYTSGTVVGETVYKEKTAVHPIPYFVTAKEHRADIDVIFTFKYKDGTVQKDTLSDHRKSVEKPGKSYYSTEKLELQLRDMILAKVSGYKSLVDYKEVAINFPKIKIKNKALKAEYDGIKPLLKEGEYTQAGAIVKKIYEAEKTPELSQAVGICYELVGNYDKAAEYYKAMPDFHIKVRMKNNIAVLDYAKSIGYEPEFIEF